eukprot:9501973-Pyramimonas_sp.AAC.1
MVLASIRGVRITCEPPLNSLFYELPSVKAAIYMCALSRHVSWMGGWGGLTLKPDEFYTNLNFKAVARISKSHREARVRIGPPSNKKGLTARTRKASGQSSWVVGRKPAMKRSARYPPEFTLALSDVVRSGLSRRAAEISARTV